MVVPVALDPTVGVAPDELEPLPGRQRIPGEDAQPETPSAQTESYGQGDLAVVVAMAGGLVVNRVAFLVPDVVGPTDERIDLLEERVEILRLEDRSVLKLVYGDQPHERANGPVYEQRRHQEWYRPRPVGAVDVEECEVRQGPGHEEEPEVAKRLGPAAKVVALHQFGEGLPIDGASVPVDLEVGDKRRLGGSRLHGHPQMDSGYVPETLGIGAPTVDDHYRLTVEACAAPVNRCRPASSNAQRAQGAVTAPMWNNR